MHARRVLARGSARGVLGLGFFRQTPYTLNLFMYTDTSLRIMNMYIYIYIESYLL